MIDSNHRVVRAASARDAPLHSDVHALAVEVVRQAMNTAEIEIFNMRVAHFTSVGSAGAEALADLLVQRDRSADPRILCVECQFCHPGPGCCRGLAVLNDLHGCDHYAGHPGLERPLP